MQAEPIDEVSSPWRCWHDAVLEENVDRAIGDLYQHLDDEVRRRGPTCWTSGRCCRFDDYGHRLYVTALEIAWVVGKVHRDTCKVESQEYKVAGDARGPVTLQQFQSSQAHQSGCPYQVDKLCSIHNVRPMGCRLFFCQQGTQHWQHELHEQFLGKLRTLHDELELPYAYMEWRTGLHQALQTFDRQGR